MAQKKVVLRLKLKEHESSEPRVAKVAAPAVITEWNYPRIAAALVVLVLMVGAIVYFASSGDGEGARPGRDRGAEVSAKAPPVEAGEPQPAAGDDAGAAPADAEAPVAAAADGTRSAPPAAPSSAGVDAMKKDAPAGSGVQTVAPRPPEEDKAVAAAATAASAPAAPVESAPAPAKKTLGKGVVRAQLSRGIWQREPFGGGVPSPLRAKPDRAIGLFFFTELEGAPGERFFHQWLRDGKLVFEQPLRLKSRSDRFYTSKLLNAAMLGHWEVVLKDARGRVLYREGFDLVAPED